EADLIIHVVDVTHEDKQQQQETVINILKDLDATNVPILTVYNKRDKLTEDFIPTNHPYALISAYNNQDLDNLLEQVENENKYYLAGYIRQDHPIQGVIKEKRE